MNGVLTYLRTLVGREACHQESDRALVARFVEGRDEVAFAALVERHGPLVLAACKRWLRNEQDAEDVLQATFLVFVRSARSIQRTESAGSWLYGVALRLARKHRAAEARRKDHESQAPTRHGASPLDEMTVGEGMRLLDEELQKLSEKYRIPIILCCLEGKSREEAARELGWAPGAVKIRLERGREQLRARLARRGLTLAAALGSILLGEASAPAAVPTRLSAALVQVGVRVAAGEPLAVAASAPVEALVFEALRGSRWARLPLTSAGLGLLVACTLSGAVAWQAMCMQPEPDPSPPTVATPETVEQPPAPRVGPTITGQFRGLEDGGKTLVVRRGERDSRYPLAEGARVTVDGEPFVKLELKNRGQVTAVLDADGQRVVRATIEGETQLVQLVTLNPRLTTITVRMPSDQRTTEKTWKVHTARIRLEGQTAELAELVGCREVKLHLSVDGKRVVALDGTR